MYNLKDKNGPIWECFFFVSGSEITLVPKSIELENLWSCKVANLETKPWKQGELSWLFHQREVAPSVGGNELIQINSHQNLDLGIWIERNN